MSKVCLSNICEQIFTTFLSIVKEFMQKENDKKEQRQIITNNNKTNNISVTAPFLSAFHNCGSSG